MRSCDEEWFAIFPKRQIIRFFQFAAWRQQILRNRKVLLRLEAKLLCILDGLIDHLVCQLDWTIHRLLLAENFVADFALITTAGKTSIGKSIFKPQEELIYKVDAETDITIRLLPGQKDLNKPHVILFLPVVTDQAFIKRKGARAANNGLRG